MTKKVSLTVGTGRDIIEQIHEVIAGKFGNYDDICEIIVKKNPNTSRKIQDRYENDFIRDDDPPPLGSPGAEGIEMSFMQPFGGFRTDSLLGRFANGEIRLNTVVSDAIWVLILHYTLENELEEGRVYDAIEAAASIGLRVHSMQLNSTVGLAASTLEYREKGGNEASKINKAKNAPRNKWILAKGKDLVPKLSEVSKAEILCNHLEKKISSEGLDWKPIKADAIRKIILKNKKETEKAGKPL